jgi:hypothetical protein
VGVVIAPSSKKKTAVGAAKRISSSFVVYSLMLQQIDLGLVVLGTFVAKPWPLRRMMSHVIFKIADI